MDKVVKKRTLLRTSFAKTVKILEEEFEKDKPDKGILSDKFAKLETLNKELNECNEEILNFLLENESVEQVVLDQESEKSELYGDKFITIRRLVNENLRVNPLGIVQSEYSSTSSEKRKNIKLPEIVLKKFDGELLNYLPFWAQFKEIHENEDLSDCEKFHYLSQSMLPGSRAKEFIDSYPITSENYEKAICALKKRFGNTELLTEVYVRELLKLVIHNVGNHKDKLPLSKLIDKLEAYLRALESMGVNPENNAQWLFPLVESCLSEDVLKAWHRNARVCSEPSKVKNTDEFPSSSAQTLRLAKLMEFLHSEVENDERVFLARKSFRNFGSLETAKDKFKKIDHRVPTTAGFFAGRETRCLFCDKFTHDSKDCLTVRSLSLKEKIYLVKEKRGCLKCLRPGHIGKFCKNKIRCHICSRDHVVLLCPQLTPHSDNEKEQKKSVDSKEVVQRTMTNNECSRDIALMTLEVNILGNKTKRVRVLLDTGSQKSYILSSTAKELNLKPVSTESLAHTLFGGTYIEAKPHQKFHLRLCRPNSKEVLELEFLDQEVICGDIPRVPKYQLLTELKENKIWLSDLGSGPTKIELLIGSDVYGRLLTGKIKQLQGGLTAVQTKLGWTVCGPVENSSTFSVNPPNILSNLAIREMKVQELWKLETIGIGDPVETLSKKREEDLAYQIFLEEVSRSDDGRYRVSLPWVNNNRPDIPSNRHIAERRLLSTSRKLKSLNKLQEYNKVFTEWLEEGVIEEVPKQRSEMKGHFLPHHAVIKEESLTTKIRPVFDASCKRDRNPSLNDCLLKGPNLIEQIPTILLRFREKAIGVVSDIRRAFLQIEVKPEDRDYLRFLWWKNEEQIMEFHHNRVVFGATCSPFLLGAVIRYHLSTVSEEWKNFAENLSKSFYVDNCISSVENEADLKEFIVSATEIMSKAKMDLRMWEFGPLNKVSLEFLSRFSEAESNSSVPILGLEWDKKDDTLKLNSKIELKKSPPSKREILSITQSIFDPIGYLAPALLPAKILIQDAWALKSDWDAPLPDSISQDFLKWYNEVEILQNIRLPRRVGFGQRDNWTLHTFCDASKSAFATVIYLRCDDNTKVSVQMLGAKSRLSPLKKITIPRLELLACVLGARLFVAISEALDLSDIPVFFWTDSTTALAWIQRNNEWGTFVGNRVKEICELTVPQRWYFVPSEMNAADLPSRGCSPRQLLASRWWEGPDWLNEDEIHWPKLVGQINEETVKEERKKGSVMASLTLNAEANHWYCKFSQFSKIVRILGWVKRFILNARKIAISRENKLSVKEIENAEKILWRTVQQDNFQMIENSCKGLAVVKDEEGLIRVKTKIVESEDEFAFRYPILLPAKTHLVTCLMQELHAKSCHAGVNILSAKLREKYFIIASRRALRSVVTKCTVCKRFNTKSFNTPPIHLPLDRVRNAATFEVVGIDLCGPLFLRNRSKVWIVLYTCAVYRAVHLELVASLNTETFLQALRRFIARRGRPSTIYTDNGTNFTGADSALKRLNWQTIELSTSGVKPLNWKFIPPTAAWWGGWWERLIRSVKSLLLRVLGNSSVNYEELLTILCDVEAQINNRPLTYISNSSSDLIPLTPAMFLSDIPETGVPDLDSIDRQKVQLRLKHCTKLRDELRARFRKEYLGQLVQRAGEKSPSLKVGDVVLVGQEMVKRQLWPMARVEKLFPSRDGCSRVARLKTNKGILVRPLQRLYPLELADDEPIIKVIPEKVSRFGRKVKPVQRFIATGTIN